MDSLGIDPLAQVTEKRFACSEQGLDPTRVTNC